MQKTNKLCEQSSKTNVIMHAALNAIWKCCSAPRAKTQFHWWSINLCANANYHVSVGLI